MAFPHAPEQCARSAQSGFKSWLDKSLIDLESLALVDRVSASGATCITYVPM